MTDILLYCRPGFEGECSLEFSQLSKRFGPGETVHAVPGSGYAVFRFADQRAALACARGLPFASVTFARQLIAAFGEVGPLEPGNRVAPVADAVAKSGHTFSGFFLETADTNEAKQLSPLCRKLEVPFEKALRGKGLLADKKDDETSVRLHVFFTSTDSAIPGMSFINNSSPWPMGIPRLRFPAGAPSRSALKLEGAWNVFMTDDQKSRMLKPGLSAVDLGASPGGWSWQLAGRGLKVTAVDNGRLEEKLLRSGLVRHVKADAFTFAPKEPAYWMVCDVVEQPSRIAKLAADWIVRQWCRVTVFNLKLPMKKRYEEVVRCGEIIRAELSRHGVRHELSIKHLYHDREEVTAWLCRL
ncbi:MAG TPA: 23S rRNA (cytidine(2498)-2'-O)-methyltransferase RlmM [Chitinivibrionales bacterium]|nr:23S rRNA (cytidine(2498)-2'-O)-methyltransferase RlmM [Chitinivibrionales bacterium]